MLWNRVKDRAIIAQILRGIDMKHPNYHPAMNYRLLYRQGLEEFHKGDYREAKRLFEEALEGQIPEAYFGLGSLYYAGKGTARNLAKAKELLTGACELGDSEGCLILALLYYDEGRSDQDLETMVRLLEQACESGIDDACRRLEYVRKKLGFFGKLFGAFLSKR